MAKGATSIRISSCNIGNSEEHNRRSEAYIQEMKKQDRLYVRTDLSQLNESWQAASLMQAGSLQEYDRQLREWVKEKTGRALSTTIKKYKDKKTGNVRSVPGSSPIREGVLVINQNTSMSQILSFVAAVKQKYGINTLSIYTHKDEGHYEGDEWKPNLHAHIIFDWINHDTGKTYSYGKEFASDLEDLASLHLNMPRGEKKQVTGRRHLTREEYITKVKINELYMKQEEVQKQRDTLQSQKNELNTEVNGLLSAKDTLNSTITSLKSEKQQLENAIKDIPTVEELTAETKELLEKKQQLEDAIRGIPTAEQIMAETQQLQAQYNSLKTEQNALLAQRETLGDEVYSLKSQKAQLLTEKDELQNKRDTLQSQKEELNTVVNGLQSEKNTLSSTITALKSEKQQLENDIKDIPTVEELTAETKELREKKQQLEDAIKDIPTVEQLKAETQQLQAQYNSLKTEQNTLFAQKETLSNEVSLLKSQKTQLQTEKTDLQDQRDTLYSQKNELSTEVNGLQSEKNTLSSTITALKSEKQQLENDIKDIPTVEELTAETKELCVKKQQLENDITEGTKKLVRIQYFLEILDMAKYIIDAFFEQICKIKEAKTISPGKHSVKFQLFGREFKKSLSHDGEFSLELAKKYIINLFKKERYVESHQEQEKGKSINR